eukprot:TRINITY_DN3450_c0_g1_i3.p1 TRINITY_DN3450_c0_g1~~TRINITY_DN3450_c0_g1_i3.p1  ORF type:complete len:205 (-),score=27.80 TRINITY_DN3450_c0_g1_i3:181-795(-)
MEEQTSPAKLAEPLKPSPEDNIHLLLCKQQLKSILSTCYSICFMLFILDFAVFLVSKAEYFRNPCFIASEIAGWLSPTVACAFLCKLHEKQCSVAFFAVFGMLWTANVGLMIAVGRELWQWAFKWHVSLYLAVSIIRGVISIYLMFKVKSFLSCTRKLNIIQDRVDQLKEEIRSRRSTVNPVIVPNIIKNTEEIIVEYNCNEMY